MLEMPKVLDEQESWLESLDSRDYYTHGDTNMINMAEWSILSTQMHYACHPEGQLPGLLIMQSPDKFLEDWHAIEGPPSLEMVPEASGSIMEDFLDQYDEVCCALHIQKKFHDNRDISTTYLGVESMHPGDKFEPELSFPIYSNSRTWGQIAGGGMVDILLDTGASKCYMSKSFYQRNAQLHSIPKLSTYIKSLTVGNGQLVNTLFVIPIVIKILLHRFEIFALVAEIQDNIDLVFGMKNMFEVEGELSCRHSEFRFLNRAAPLFPIESFSLKPGNKRFVKVKAQFYQHLTGTAIVKLVQGSRTLTLQMKIQDNLGVLDFVNTSKTTLFCDKNKSLGIVDIRSLGYFNIRHLTLEV